MTLNDSMDGNGWIWLELLEMLKMAGMDGNCWKWLEWLKVDEIG